MGESRIMPPLGAPQTPGENPEGRRRNLTLLDFAHLDFISEVFLPEARSRGVVTAEQDADLAVVVADLMREASGGLVPESVSVPTESVVARHLEDGDAFPDSLLPALPAVLPTPEVPPPAPAPHRAPHPSPLRLWWGRTVEAVGSDLAVHGLAYLGVLLFFVGAFGLVAFAFGDVARELRPVAELVIAAAPFGAGALLRRRRAEYVGRALELAGGLVLPLMLVTTFLDGVPVPPDLSGTPLVVALTTLMVMVAGAYALWSVRMPDSALRFLVGPVGWLAVGLATMGVGQPIPVGKAVANPSAAQLAVMAVAVVVTVALARLRPGSRLAAPALTAAVPGLVAIATLAVLTWAAQGSTVAVLVSGVAVLVTIELLAPLLPAAVAGLAEPLWWVVVWSALVTNAGSGRAAAAASALGALGFVAILERAGAAPRRPAPALALPALGVVLTLAATWIEPGWAAGSLGLAAVWAAVRRVEPYASRRAAQLLDLAAAVLPIVAVLAVVAATDAVTGALAAAVLVLGVAVPARRGWLSRRPDETYWPQWWLVGMALTTVLALQVWVDLPGVRELWLLGAAFAVLGLAALVGPVTVGLRVPAVVVWTSLSYLAVSTALGMTEEGRLSLLAVAGLVLVIVAHASNVPALAGGVVSLGLTGHVLGSAALIALFETRWGVVMATAAATIGWGLTGWLDAQGRSAVGAALRSADPVLGWLPLGFAVVGLPMTVSLGLDRSDVLLWSSTWAPAVPAVAGIAFALLARTPSGLVPERVGRASSWGAFGAGLVGPVLAQHRLPAIAGLVALVLAVIILPARDRSPIMTWVAWAAPVPMAYLIAQEVWPWFSLQPIVVSGAIAMVAVGALLVVGAASADLAGRQWTPQSTPEHDWAVVPMVVGSVALTVGVASALASSPDTVAGWLCVTTAVAALAVSVLSRAGVLSMVWAGLGWWAALLLARPAIESRSWVPVVAALALLLVAQVLSMRRFSGPWWARWDAPLLIAAAPIAASALVLGGWGPGASLVQAAVGAECVAVSVRLRRLPAVALPLGVVGAALVLVGAGWAGTGWLALALALLSIALTVLGLVAAEPWRPWFRLGGAVVAVVAWGVALGWLGWPEQTAVDVTALLAASVVVTAAAATLWPRTDRGWVLVWGGAGMVVTGSVLAAVLLPADARPFLADGGPSWAVALGAGAVAIVAAGSAARIRVHWLRELAVAFLMAGLLVVERVATPSVTVQVWVLCMIAAVSAGGLLALAGGRFVTRWRRPLVGLGVVLTLWAWALAWSGAALSGSALLAAPLAVAALLAAGSGVAYDRVGPQLLSPGFAAGAWIAFAIDSFGGHPQWITAPVGLAALCSVGLWRRFRGQRGERVTSREIVSLEQVGVVLLVGPSLVQAVTDSPAYVVVALVLGLCVAAWGAVTKVRRRVASGALAVAAAVLIFVAVPLVQLLPSWEGAALWALIAVVGLVAVLVAAFLERGKTAARKGLARFLEVTADWE